MVRDDLRVSMVSMSTRTKYYFNNLDSFPSEIIMWYYITLGFSRVLATMFYNSKQRIQCVGETYSIIQLQSQLSSKSFATMIAF